MPFHGTLTLEFNGISGSERHEDGWIVLTEVPAGAAPFRAVPFNLVVGVGDVAVAEADASVTMPFTTDPEQMEVSFSLGDCDVTHRLDTRHEFDRLCQVAGDLEHLSRLALDRHLKGEFLPVPPGLPMRVVPDSELFPSGSVACHACHRQGSTVACPFGEKHRLCHRCLPALFEVSLEDVKQRPEEWVCPICIHLCPCPSCDKMKEKNADRAAAMAIALSSTHPVVARWLQSKPSRLRRRVRRRPRPRPRSSKGAAKAPAAPAAAAPVPAPRRPAPRKGPAPAPASAGGRSHAGPRHRVSGRYASSAEPETEEEKLYQAVKATITRARAGEAVKLLPGLATEEQTHRHLMYFRLYLPIADRGPVPKRGLDGEVDSFEETCFVCLDGGELVCCDGTDFEGKPCCKTYHSPCVNEDPSSEGDYFCPRHRCAVCWEGATRSCRYCPTSYCRKHLPADLFAFPYPSPGAATGAEVACETCELKLRMLTLWPPSEAANAAVPEQVRHWTGEDEASGNRPSPAVAGAASGAAAGGTP